MSLHERLESVKLAMAEFLADNDAVELINWISAYIPDDALTSHEAQILGVLCQKLSAAGVAPEVVGTYMAVSITMIGGPAGDGGEGDEAEDDPEPSIPVA